MSADKITSSETPRTLPEYVKCITDDGQELPMRRCPACKKPSFIGYRCDGCDLAAERERADREHEDAERYRWLRDTDIAVVAWIEEDGPRWSIEGRDGHNITRDKLDAAIDAARRK